MTTEQLLRLNSKLNALTCAYFEAEDSDDAPALDRIGAELDQVEAKLHRHSKAASRRARKTR